MQKSSRDLEGQRESFVGIILAVAVIFIGVQYQKVSYEQLMQGRVTGIKLNDPLLNHIWEAKNDVLI